MKVNNETNSLPPQEDSNDAINSALCHTINNEHLALLNDLCSTIRETNQAFKRFQHQETITGLIIEKDKAASDNLNLASLLTLVDSIQLYLSLPLTSARTPEDFIALMLLRAKKQCRQLKERLAEFHQLNPSVYTKQFPIMQSILSACIENVAKLKKQSLYPCRNLALKAFIEEECQRLMQRLNHATYEIKASALTPRLYYLKALEIEICKKEHEDLNACHREAMKSVKHLTLHHDFIKNILGSGHFKRQYLALGFDLDALKTNTDIVVKKVEADKPLDEAVNEPIPTPAKVPLHPSSDNKLSKARNQLIDYLKKLLREVSNASHHSVDDINQMQQKLNTLIDELTLNTEISIDDGYNYWKEQLGPLPTPYAHDLARQIYLSHFAELDEINYLKIIEHAR